MIKAIAIDDEPLALKVIENFCGIIDFITLEKTFSKPKEALDYLDKFPVDLLFLDINMPSVDGIEFCKNLKQNTMVIFTTAYSEYAVDAFNLKAIDYLLKPFSYIRFLNACNKANDIFAQQAKTDSGLAKHFFVRADYSLVRVNFTDVLYIEGLDDYVKIFLEKQKPLITRMTMKSILEKLPSEDFIRVHRSFIVPLKRIKGVRSKVISIEGKEIPIGNSYEESFLKTFKK